MKKILSIAILLSLLIISFLTLKSCRSGEETASCFPHTAINVQLNLNLPAYYPLQTVGGWVYINEQSAGTRGLIVVRTGSGFNIYDRNAPHICPDSNTTLSVQDDIKIVCPKDGSEWILLTGQPTKVASVSPKTYTYTYNTASNILNIYN